MARNMYNVDEKLETPFNFKHLKRALVYVKRHRWKMVLALLLSCAASIISLCGPKLMQWALDDAIPHKNVQLLMILGAGFAATILCNTLFTTIRARIMAHVSQDVIFDIRKDLFAHLQELPFSYYDSRPAGKILVRVINYVNSVSDILSNGIINMVLEFINLIFITIFMFQTNALLATVIVAGLPFFVAFIFLVKPKQRKAWQSFSNKNSNYTAYLAESIDGVRVTQLYNRQKENIGIMQKLISAYRATWLKAVYISNMVGSVSELISQLVYAMVYVAGVYWLGGTMVSFGVIMAMASYSGRFWQPIMNIANIYNQFVNNIAYLERIFETMDEPSDITDAPDAKELPPIHGEVTFRNVTFGYEPDVHILENLNLDVRAGESVALVGPTGAGKTTVVNLISRFYNVNEGQILMDGSIDITRVTLHSLRTQMGIMLQDSFIFSGTIRDNICYGRPDATPEQVEAAARAVCAHDFIMQMENGYDTQVNERGSRLSQGQKQLIAFARTLLCDPRVLILDEATSSIDTHTEQLLQAGIQVLLKGRTSFIIAHRLSTIKHCDRILYIGNKGIQEQGTHEELMAKKGLYYQLYTAQAKVQGVSAVEP